MLRLWNTLENKKQVFKPIKRKSIGLYTCGPTVYDFAHIGNLRTYIFEDILRRTLKAEGFNIQQVMNITDIDDKTIKRANAENKDFKDIAEKFEKEFLIDINKLNIEPAEFYPRATEHISEMIELIKILLKRKFAYQGADNSIYFSIEKFKNYGKLSGLKKRELKIGARIAADEYNKDEAQDFVLWKTKKENEPSWPSPWGEGRPGWHIECSAMSEKYLGKTFDIHTGGVDNIFPHHENEIAQSESANKKKFVNYWIHGEHLLVDGKKMSKSLGNFYTLRDLENKGFSPLSFRYLCLSAHYRSKLNFTWESLEGAEQALKKLFNEFDKLISINVSEKLSQPAKKYSKDFIEAFEDDLNAPKALAVLWGIIKSNLPEDEKKALLLEVDKILGFGLKQRKIEEIPQKIKDLVKERELSRRNQQFAKSDALRKEIESLGYKIDDTADGTIIKKNNE